MTRETLDDLFEAAAQDQARRADELENDEAYQRRVEAKRRSEIERQIKAGLRDANGDWIETEGGDEEE